MHLNMPRMIQFFVYILLEDSIWIETPNFHNMHVTKNTK